MPKFTIAVYLVDKAYGGPEEGGWWYTYGDLIRIVAVCGNEATASARCSRLNDLLNATLNKGRRSISSVLSEGRYQARVFGYDDELAPPKHFPETRPYYE